MLNFFELLYLVSVLCRFATFNLNCNKTSCDCNEDKFSPICGQDGKTYLSPCHAGCRNYTEKDGKIVEYSDCLCVSNEIDNITLNLPDHLFNGNASIGYCDIKCPNFAWYIILFSIFVFIHSTSEVGSMLLILRCVDPRDKAMALGLIQFAIGLFGNVPCPIVYGAVVDSACLVWKMACGEKGACGLYDSNIFRMFYHGNSITTLREYFNKILILAGTTGAILLCAFFVDVIVWYKAGSINFVDEQVPLEEELTSMTKKSITEPVSLSQ